MEHRKLESFSLRNVDVIDQKFGKDYPLAVTPRTLQVDLGSWMKDNRDWVAGELSKVGAILFRGFDLNTPDAFRNVANSYECDILDYKERTSPRSQVLDKIYSSTDYPPELIINMHTESSYSPNWPRKLMFFCNVSPQTGGETPIADTRRVLELLGKDVQEKFARLGVMYKRTLGTVLGLSWQETFQTDKKEEVNAICKSNGMDHQWDGGLLKLRWTRPALQVHPVSGETTWFNHAFFYHKSVAYDPDVLEILSDDEIPFCSFYGDGSEIEPDVIDKIRSAYSQTIVEFPWQKGDLLLVDNLLVAHGRNPFTGPRQILVALFNT
jgi:alpha-ketoglutarate-dependent taurine dioxygenase